MIKILEKIKITLKKTFNNIRLKVFSMIDWIEMQLVKESYFPYWNRLKIKNDIHRIKDGNIVWDNKKSFNNHIEMTGLKVSTIVSYKVTSKKKLKLNKHIAFPLLRYKPNTTRCHIRYNVKEKDDFLINGDKFTEEPYEISFNGKLTIKSKVGNLRVIREISPLQEKMGICEKVEIIGDCTIDYNLFRKPSLIDKQYTIEKKVIVEDKNVFYQIYIGYKDEFQVSTEDTKARDVFLQSLDKLISLDTPNSLLNTAFRYSKFRVCESIQLTKNGLIHSPGGGKYYAGAWTNDQCEYTNPLFPFIGYKVGIEQSINVSKLFGSYENIPASLVSEAELSMSVAKDRGDSVMYASGVSRFCLANGDIEVTKKLWKFIKKNIYSSLSKINNYGVVESDSDELENRFESGSSNLFTSVLLYDALIHASYIANELNDVSFDFKGKANELAGAIESYFGKTVKGYKTYQYYHGNKKLRGWISVPIAFGIHERKEDTIKALYSKFLWCDGIRTIQDYDLIWDRTTLYGLRAGFIAGWIDETLNKLNAYTESRIISSHMPYPTEAFPEGNRVQLSGESALYMRVITEGLFKIKVVSHKSFIVNPILPKNWDYMNLRNLGLFGKSFDILVTRGEKLEIISESDFVIEKHKQGYIITFD